MDPILETAMRFFVEDGWKFTRIQGKPLLSLPFRGDHGNWQCWAQVLEERQQFIFYSVCPVNVPEGKRLAVAEYLTRANYGLVIGNFEMDFRDGEVRYKTSIDVEGAEIAPALVRNLVYANVITMDRYLPGLLGVIYGNLTPEQAIAQVEG